MAEIERKSGICSRAIGLDAYFRGRNVIWGILHFAWPNTEESFLNPESKFRGICFVPDVISYAILLLSIPAGYPMEGMGIKFCYNIGVEAIREIPNSVRSIRKMVI